MTHAVVAKPVSKLAGYVYVVSPFGTTDSKQLQAAFEDFVDQYGHSESTRLLFYFSGHGHTRANNTKGYLVPTDARYRYVADKMKMVAGHHFASYWPLANILL